MSHSLKADIEKAVADSKRLDEEYFVKQCKGSTATEILNFYRNYYYTESVNTEHGLVAAAMNEVLPTYTRLLKIQQLLHDGKVTEAMKLVLR